LENAGVKIDFITRVIYGMPLAQVVTAVSFLVLMIMFVQYDNRITLDFLANNKG